MEVLYVKKVYSVNFAELAIDKEIKGAFSNHNGIKFSVSFVESEPDNSYSLQCPMDIDVISIHTEIPRKIPDILLKISKGFVVA